MGGEDHRTQPPSRQEIPRAGGLRCRPRSAGENHSWAHSGGGLGCQPCRQGQPRRTLARQGSATSAARRQEQLAGDYFGRRQEPADSASARNAGSRSVAPGTSVDRAARTRRSEEGRGAAVDAGGKAGHRSGAASGCVGTAALVFSSMTSFTHCSGTSFTLRRERSERGSAIQDDMGKCGYSGTTGAFCGGGESAGEEFPGPLSGVRGIPAHWIYVAAAVSGTGFGGHRRTQPSSASQSAADRRGVGGASRPTAATLSGLGSAQAAGAAPAGGGELTAEYHSSHSVAARVGADRGSACGGAAALRARRARPALADGFQRLHGTGWETAVGPLSVLDDHSRYLIALRGTWTTKAEPVREHLESAFSECGVPEAMLMDHGTPWWNANAPTGATWLTVWLMRQGIELHWSGYRHPQTQGKVERFHGSLQRTQGRRGVPEQERQRWLDEYRHEYNQVRPHEALGMQTPASRWRPSERRYDPNPQPWQYPEGATVVKVGSQGQIWAERRWDISLALAGQWV